MGPGHPHAWYAQYVTPYTIPPQGRFQLYVQVWDEDGRYDDKVNDIYIQNYLTVSSSWTRQYTFYGNSNRYTVWIRMSFRVRCNSNYYGSNCATYCVPTDNSNGHYTCGSNGQKICRSGWSNPSGNCRTRKL